MRVTSVGSTDVGRKREANQDSLLLNDDLGLYVVADGMGGHAGGETASRLAVETIEKNLVAARANGSDPFAEKVPLPESELPERFREAVEAACYTIFHTAREQPHLQGMGTTVTALLLKESARPGAVDAYLAHVGDSRVYLVRDTIVQQVSEDHSLVNEQIKAGVITPEEAKQSRFKNIITRSVGFEEDVLVDVMGLWAEPGDVFLMCSDGLSNLVDEAEILDTVREFRGERLRDLPAHLIGLANERGGDDNITVLVVRVEEP
jgi:PPM family protein phosphatase